MAKQIETDKLRKLTNKRGAVKRIENNRSRKLTYKRRMASIKKKTMELATLCGIKACTVFFGPNGDVETWPETASEVRTVIKMYKHHCRSEAEIGSETGTGTRTGTRTRTDVLNDRIEKVDREIVAAKRENLRKILRLMQSNLEVLTARVEFLKTAIDDDDQINAKGKEIVIYRFDEMLDETKAQRHPQNLS